MLLMGLISANCDGVILYVTQSPGAEFYDADIDAMILAQDLGVATLNGYSGNLPPG